MQQDQRSAVAGLTVGETHTVTPGVVEHIAIPHATDRIPNRRQPPGGRAEFDVASGSRAGRAEGAPGAYLAHWAAVMELPVEEHKVAAATSETR